MIMAIRDTAEQRKEGEMAGSIETIVKQALDEWMMALDVVEDPIFIHDAQMRILRCNRAYQEKAGIPFSQLIGRLYYEVFPVLDAPLPHCREAIEHPQSKEKPHEIEIDGAIYRSRSYSVTDHQGHYRYSVHILEDITEREQTARALRESEERFKAIFDNASDGILVADIPTRIFKIANPGICKMLGYTCDELLALRIDDVHPTDALARGIEEFERQQQKNTSVVSEIPLLRKDGTIFYADINPFVMTIEGKAYMAGFVRDITERKKAEEALERANRALRTLSAGNLALIRAHGETELLKSVASVIVKKGGYSLASVCYADDDPDRTIRSIARAGKGDAYFCTDIHLSWAENDAGNLPMARAIRDSKTQICRDILAENAYTPWKEALIAHGLVSTVALPLRDNDRTFGVLSIYSYEHEIFDKEEVRLLEELADDLAYGITNLRAREEHERRAVLLRQSLEQSVQTIAATLEARDPYTAGHQRRVAELATAIAREMGLDDDRVQGIHFAAIIHDLGKIHIPAEILSNPGRLNKIEHMLIQTHPQEGYEILKEVEFPWPIAQIVLQHHEKLDGSGYPQGLTADQILPEAKIICVADVVEAMSSHRPYRPGLGLEAALAEITRGRGTAYDAVVVDICLKLFGEKGFAFSDEG